MSFNKIITTLDALLEARAKLLKKRDNVKINECDEQIDKLLDAISFYYPDKLPSLMFKVSMKRFGSDLNKRLASLGEENVHD